jgi:hypothetical protein
MTIFQAFVQEQEAGFIPEKPLNAILSPSTEKEQGRLMRIQPEA